MAVWKRDEVLFGGSAELPNGVYTVRVKTAKKDKSQAGADMAVLQCEIIAPERVQVGDKVYAVAGREFRIYNLLDPQVEWGLGRLWDGLEKAGFDFTKMSDDGSFDDTKLATLNGFSFDMMLSTEPRLARRPLTPDDIRAGKKVGDPMKDAAGNEIVLGHDVQANLQNVVGPASTVSDNPVW